MPTIDRLLDLRAADSADTTFLRFSAGDLTFGEARRRSMGLARGLADLGVQRGQLVPVLMANGPDFAITWLALCTLGAVSTLLNTEFRGPALVHALNLSGAETVVVDADSTRILPTLPSSLSTFAGWCWSAARSATRRRPCPSCRVCRSSITPRSAPTTSPRSPRFIRSPIRRWCCSPRARPVRRRAACCRTATPYARPS